MYRRSKSLGTILEIRQEMARQADHDVDLFVELVRSGKFSKTRQSKTGTSATRRKEKAT
jgi:hypothetical protein